MYMLACISSPGISRGGCFSATRFTQSSLAAESLYRLLGNSSRVSCTCSVNISKRLKIKFKHPLIPSCLSTWLLPRKNLCVHGDFMCTGVFPIFPFLCSSQGAEMFHLVVPLLFQLVSTSKAETLFFAFHQKRTQMQGLLHFGTRVSITF